MYCDTVREGTNLYTRRKGEERKERKLTWIVVEEGVDDFGGDDTKDDKERKLEETLPEEIVAVGDVVNGDQCRRRCHRRRSSGNIRGSEIVAEAIQENSVSTVRVYEIGEVLYLGGSFHQKTNNISYSKLSKPSISVALPSLKCQTIQTDDFRACCLSPQLWLALGRIFIGQYGNTANHKLGRRGSRLSKLSTTVIGESPQKSSSRVHKSGTLYSPRDFVRL
ncbi:uncharacterized protein DS421_1g14000 [Arachis hypogaea]|nr:uncharacterized protein DS421_1g14000 [Arachis hypogaea]